MPLIVESRVGVTLRGDDLGNAGSRLLDSQSRFLYRDEPTPEELREWEAEFEAAARRPLRTRVHYAFISTYKPVLDDASYRSFDSMAEYRSWCEANLPSWLGYGRDV